MRYAYDRGIRFFDTAELYDNYAALRLFLTDVDRASLVLATKSYAYDRTGAEASVQKALDALDTDYLDIFLLHEQESEHTLRGHHEALETLHAMKGEGRVRRTGLSTHHVAAVRAALDDPLIEVIHPIVNKEGLGLADGTMADLLPLLEKARERGKFIYGMKPLGGGHLIGDYAESFRYALSLDVLDAVAIGMGSEEEIDANVHFAKHQDLSHPAFERLSKRRRKLLIHDWCTGCGACAEVCGQGALSLRENQMTVDPSRCVLCGYCAPVCPDFCIKVVDA